jgi:shikimate dehydrogenase
VQKKFYAGVLGFPISHSLSPQIFEYLAMTLGESLDYRKIEVRPQDLDSCRVAIQKLKLLQGCNVTLPHKEAVLSWMDELSKEARALGAVNVIRQDSKGRLSGYNTDVIGVKKALQEQKFKVSGRSAVIFGAGGAALAVGYVLGQLKASDVWIVNRTVGKARLQSKKLSRLFSKTTYHPVGSVSKAYQSDPVLYVNATPLGMAGFPPGDLLPESQFLRVPALAFDLVYRPQRTAFLRTAHARGLSTLGGLDMLIWQALATWEIWMGPIAHAQRLKVELKKVLIKYCSID